MKRAGEFAWIARYLAPLASDSSFGLKDDAALLEIPKGCGVCITQDAILEDVHFLSTDPPSTVAQKALRVNISDCVAKGATPFAYSLALGVPDRWRDEDMAEFALGLAQDQDLYEMKLTGGDTYRSPERLAVSVTMLATVSGTSNAYVSRLDAKPGESLFVTGTIGDSSLGLKVAQGELRTSNDGYFINRYQVPRPPQTFESVMKYASAGMDVSDGLLGDARKLALASNVQVRIERDQVPLSNEVQQLMDQDELWETVLTGGDDYQVLFSVQRDRVEAMLEAAESIGIQVTKIGEIREKASLPVSLTVDGVPMSYQRDSFNHF